MSVVNHMRRIDNITNHIEKLRIRLLISSEKRDRNLLVNMMEKHRNPARPLTPLQPIQAMRHMNLSVIGLRFPYHQTLAHKTITYKL
jgi:hypothetical protein